MKRFAGWTAMVVVTGAILWGTVGSDSYYEKQADEAIAAAVSACTAGSRIEFSRRIVEAEMSFRNAPRSVRGELPARLDNRLRMVGCSR